MPLITASLTRSGADQFNPVAGQGLISFPLSRSSATQALVVPHVGIYCAGGSIGDIAIYWQNPSDPSGRIPIDIKTQVELVGWDGAAWLRACPGIAPRIPITPSSDGLSDAGGGFWDLAIESSGKSDDATASYSYLISPAPSEVQA